MNAKPGAKRGDPKAPKSKIPVFKLPKMDIPVFRDDEMLTAQ